MTSRYNVNLLPPDKQERLVELTEHLNEGIPLMTSEQEELEAIMQLCLEEY
jgi:hypothetical protein